PARPAARSLDDDRLQRRGTSLQVLPPSHEDIPRFPRRGDRPRAGRGDVHGEDPQDAGGGPGRRAPRPRVSRRPLRLERRVRLRRRHPDRRRAAGPCVIAGPSAPGGRSGRLLVLAVSLTAATVTQAAAAEPATPPPRKTFREALRT